jgi:hypothetical protein
MIVYDLWGEEVITQTKVCMVCKEVKHIDTFGVRSYRKDGTPETKNTCKSCLSIDAKILRNYKKISSKPVKDYACPSCSYTEEQIREMRGGLQGHTPMTSKSIWTLDHDHATNKEREYICLYCNDVAGRANDSPEILENVAKYLRKHMLRKNN